MVTFCGLRVSGIWLICFFYLAYWALEPFLRAGFGGRAAAVLYNKTMKRQNYFWVHLTRNDTVAMNN
jgi:hypothetical protein